MTPERAILDLLARRAPGRTICPSEAARVLVAGGEDWRARMHDVRAAAGSLGDRGALEVTQSGRVVDVRTVRGPIRLRLTGS